MYTLKCNKKKLGVPVSPVIFLRKADSGVVWKFVRVCFQNHHLWNKRKGGSGEQREQPSYITVSTKVSADLVGKSEAKVAP